MRNKRYRSLALACCCLLAFSLAAMPLVAEEQAPDLSQVPTEQLLSRALEISKLLDPGLKTQVDDWTYLRDENETLRSDLQTAEKELESLKAELLRRSSEATASADELREARLALSGISALIKSSSLSWRNSIGAVDQALKEASMKQRRTELAAWGCGGLAVAATAWAVAELVLRKAGR